MNIRAGDTVELASGAFKGVPFTVQYIIEDGWFMNREYNVERVPAARVANGRVSLMMRQSDLVLVRRVSLLERLKRLYQSLVEP